jgi:hypothetical protein
MEKLRNGEKWKWKRRGNRKFARRSTDKNHKIQGESLSGGRVEFS